MSNKRKETDEYSFENVHECYIYSWLENVYKLPTKYVFEASTTKA